MSLAGVTPPPPTDPDAPPPPPPRPIWGLDSDFENLTPVSKTSCLIDPPGWNWNSNLSTNWPVIPPWSQSMHFGYDLSKTKMCYEDGWRLYSKKLTCADWFDDDCSNISNDTYVDPVFSLYNIYTGHLRTFIYMREAFDNDYKTLVKLEVVSGSSKSTYGLLLNDLDNAIAYPDKENENFENLGQLSALGPFGQKWAVVEHYISYDPEIPESGLVFKFTISGHERSELSLGGEFSFTIDQNAIENNQHMTLSSAVGALKDAGKAYKEPADWAKDTLKEGEKLKASGIKDSSPVKESLGDDLMQMAGLMASGSSTLGVLNAGASILGALNNSSTGGFQTLYGDGEVTLSGQINNIHDESFFSLGVHNSNFISNSDYAELDFTGNIGLFRFTERPTWHFDKTQYMQFADDVEYWDMSPKDLKTIIEVNPDSEMELVAYRVAPVFLSDFTLTCEDHSSVIADTEAPDCVGYLDATCGFANSKYDKKRKIEPLLIFDAIVEEGSENRPMACTTTLNEFTDTESVKVYNHAFPLNRPPNLKPGDFIPLPEGTGIRAVNLKVLLLFKHKTKENIYVETLRTIRMNTTGTARNY